MYFRNDFLVLGNQVRSIILVPLNPIFPHFYDFFSVELSSYTEPGDCVYICVKILFLFQVLVLISENFDDFLLIGLNLGQFAVGDTYRVAS